jgi:hypothetical protein
MPPLSPSDPKPQPTDPPSSPSSSYSTSNSDHHHLFTNWPYIPNEPTTSKPPTFIQKLVRALLSRKSIDIIKGCIAVLLALTFSFWSTTTTSIQARTHSNILLVSIAMSPAQTIGAMLDSSLINISSLTIAGGYWAFINTVAGQSYPWMGVLGFIGSYGFLYIRTWGERWFGFSLIGCLMIYTASSSAVGINGANTCKYRNGHMHEL